MVISSGSDLVSFLGLSKKREKQRRQILACWTLGWLAHCWACALDCGY